MDNTAKLRSQKGAIDEMQKGQQKMGAKNFSAADVHLRKAIKLAPNDYTALVMMSMNQLVQKKWAVGRQYAEMARFQLSGVSVKNDDARAARRYRHVFAQCPFE